jgi:hypothetical protein
MSKLFGNTPSVYSKGTAHFEHKSGYENFSIFSPISLPWNRVNKHRASIVIRQSEC